MAQQKQWALHYFDYKFIGEYALVSILGLVIILAIIIGVSRAYDAAQKKLAGPQEDEDEPEPDRSRPGRMSRSRMIIESFFELVFSSTAVLLFLSLYYIMNTWVPYWSGIGQIWTKYEDQILLLFILLSVIATSWFDLVLVRLHIRSSQKASIRLLSSIYIILILLYIKFIYNDSNYDSLIMYFFTLFAGRYLYFDFTWHDFSSTISGLVKNSPLLLLMIAYSGFTIWFGFHSGFLLTANGVIVSTLIAHLFMDLAIFILDKTRIIRLVS